jgi:hypothetical protein
MISGTGHWPITDKLSNKDEIFLRDLIEGTVTAKVFSFRKRKEERQYLGYLGKGESQPFRERTDEPN